MKIVVELRDDYIKESIAEQISKTVAQEIDANIRARIEQILDKKFSRVDDTSVEGVMVKAARGLIQEHFGVEGYRMRQAIDELAKSIITKIVSENLKQGLR